MSTSDTVPARSVGGWLRWLVRRPSVYAGLAGALVFFWLSLTPALLPRPWWAQGAVGGITAAIGYGLGSGASALWRRYVRREPSARVKRIAWWLLAVAAVAGTALMLAVSKGWMNELRRLMGVDPEADLAVLPLLGVAMVVAGIILLGARLARSLGRFIVRQAGRLLPRPVAVGLGVALAALIVVGFAQGFLWRGIVSAANSSAGLTDGTTSDAAKRPTSTLRSGGPESLVAWGDLGRMGRDFTGRGPTVEELRRFWAEPGCCQEPVRVYVGLGAADSAAARAELAVKELERTGAFDRKVLVVFSATGTGWINPRAAAAMEFIHRGDTAEVSMQYSYLPSWLSFLVDQSVAREAGRELIGAVVRRLDRIPAEQRPRLYLYGESLGSYASEEAFASVEDLRDKVDGALLVGPTFSNPYWKRFTDARLPGSPEWLPKVSEPWLRFAATPTDLDGFGDVDEPKLLYLQNPSDPITWFSYRMAFRRPAWTEPPAPADRSPAFRWIPIVSFAQVAIDLTDSLGVPTGKGHNFGSNVADGWVALSAPPTWQPEDTARLKAAVGERGD